MASKTKDIIVRWFPPSWLVIRAGSKIVQIDPAFLRTHFLKYPGKIEFTRWPDPIDGLPEADLPKADLALCTHAHKDHCKQVTLNRVRQARTRAFGPRGCKTELGDDFEIIAPGDAIDVKYLKISVVHAYNVPEGSSTRKAHRRGGGVGYVLDFGGVTLYHAGDTDLIPEMSDLPPIDVAFLPIGGTFTMNAAEAQEAVRIIRPRIVMPMHRLKSDPVAFKKATEAKTDASVEVLETGGTMTLARS